jgi:hypothetical protein
MFNLLSGRDRPVREAVERGPREQVRPGAGGQGNREDDSEASRVAGQVTGMAQSGESSPFALDGCDHVDLPVFPQPALLEDAAGGRLDRADKLVIQDDADCLAKERDRPTERLLEQ